MILTEEIIKTDPDSVKYIYSHAALSWGVRNQEDMAIEESAELVKAICKLRRSNNLTAKKHLLELADEIADVQIMLEQLKQMHDISDLVDNIRIQKIIRLAKRLKLDK